MVGLMAWGQSELIRVNFFPGNWAICALVPGTTRVKFGAVCSVEAKRKPQLCEL